MSTKIVKLAHPFFYLLGHILGENMKLSFREILLSALLVGAGSAVAQAQPAEDDSFAESAAFDSLMMEDTSQASAADPWSR
jgi:hypothetical protein